MTSAMMRRVERLEAATHFTVTTPADILDYPHRITMVRGEIARWSRTVHGENRWFVEAVLGFSDALLVDFLFYDRDIEAYRAAGDE